MHLNNLNRMLQLQFYLMYDNNYDRLLNLYLNHVRAFRECVHLGSVHLGRVDCILLEYNQIHLGYNSRFILTK